MAGRAAVLAWEEAKAANPCVLGDHQGSYEYGGMKYELVAHPAGASFDSCSKLVKMVLRQNLECGAPQVSIWNLKDSSHQSAAETAGRVLTSVSSPPSRMLLQVWDLSADSSVATHRMRTSSGLCSQDSHDIALGQAAVMMTRVPVTAGAVRL